MSAAQNLAPCVVCGTPTRARAVWPMIPEDFVPLCRRRECRAAMADEAAATLTSSEVASQRDALAARLAKVEALAKDAIGTGSVIFGGGRCDRMLSPRDVLAALASDPTHNGDHH